MNLEATCLWLSGDVIEGKPEALEEDRPLAQRVRELRGVVNTYQQEGEQEGEDG
jgi:hypothetical protein